MISVNTTQRLTKRCRSTKMKTIKMKIIHTLELLDEKNKYFGDFPYFRKTEKPELHWVWIHLKLKQNGGVKGF